MRRAFDRNRRATDAAAPRERPSQRPLPHIATRAMPPSPPSIARAAPGASSAPKSILKPDRARRAASAPANPPPSSAPAVGSLTDLERRELRLPTTRRVAIDGTEDAEARSVIIERASAAISRRDARGKFVGRAETLEKLRAHALRDDAPNVFVLEGERGSGVSSVLSEFVKDLRERTARMIEEEEVTGERVMGKKPLALHVCCRGPTPGECDLRHVLWTMCERVRKMLGQARFTNMPVTAEETGRVFVRLMEELALTTSSVVVLVVDDLDAAAELGSVKMSDWLPSSMMSDVRVIIGARTKGDAVNYLASGGENAAAIARKRLPPLGIKERTQLARGLFSRNDEREITSGLFEPISSYKDASSPTYIYLVAHEMRRRVKLSQRRVDAPLDVAHELRQIPETIEQLLRYIFEGLEYNHGHNVVRQLFTLMASSRAGLSANEIADIIEVGRTSSSFLALTDDVAHLCWCYEEDGARAPEMPQDALVLRSSVVIDYVRSRYLVKDEAKNNIQRDAMTYFLRKFSDTSGDFNVHHVLELLHFVRNGEWLVARDQFMGYITDPQVIHFLWKQRYINELVLSWKIATATQVSDVVQRTPMESILTRLGRMNDRTRDSCAESIADFMKWISDYTSVIAVCDLACSRATFQLQHAASLNMKYANALRQTADWEKAASVAKLARKFESANFNGNTPLGAMIMNEESLCLVRTKDEEITLDNHNLRGTKGEVEEFINDALESAEASLAAWRVCMKDKSVKEVFNHAACVTMNVATLYGLKGKGLKEIEIHEQLMDELENKLGADHDAIYREMLRLSAVYARHGEWDKSEFCMEQALKHCVDAYPDRSLGLLENLRSLAKVYVMKNDLVSAREVYEDVTKEMECVTDSNGQPLLLELLASVFTEHARVLRKLKKPEEAKQTFIKALNITKSRFGDLHHGTAERLSDLASMHLELRNFDQAKALYTKALDVDTQLFGRNHPNLAVHQIDLASVLRARGENLEALRQYKEAEAILKETNETVHPGLAASLNSLAEKYKSMDQAQRAEPLYSRAVEIAEHDFHASSELETYLINLGRCYRSQGRTLKAKACFEQALKIAEGEFDAAHTNIATRCVELGELLMEMKEWGEALPCYTRAKDIRVQKFGLDHPGTQVVLEAIKLITAELNKVKQSGVVKVKVAQYEEIAAKSAETTPTKSADVDPLLKISFDALRDSAKKQRKDSVQEALQKLASLTNSKESNEVFEEEEEVAIVKHDDIVEATTETVIVPREPPREKSKPPPAQVKVQASVKKLELGDINGFLAEFVEYTGHRQYKFKLDDKVFPRFSLIRDHVEEHFEDECRRWSRGEFVGPLAKSPVKAESMNLPSVAIKPVSSPEEAERKSHTKPPVARYAKPPIIESPQSESLGGGKPYAVARSPSDDTPQSKMRVEQPVAISGDLVTVPVKEHEYMVTKIGALESELATMREMMQRMMYDRMYAPPPHFAPPPRESTNQNAAPVGVHADYMYDRKFMSSNGYDAAMNAPPPSSGIKYVREPYSPSKHFSLAPAPNFSSPLTDASARPRVVGEHTQPKRKLFRL